MKELSESEEEEQEEFVAENSPELPKRSKRTVEKMI
jgi:hypothetical protein